MIIHCEDITLRAIEQEDLDILWEMINDPDIEHMTGGGGFPVSHIQQEEWIKSQKDCSNAVRLVIDTKEHGAIGTVALTDIDYRNRTAQFHSKIATSKDLRGHGYGTKATMALVKYAFDQMNLYCIYSYIVEYNNASQRVKEKCGFKKDGILRERVYKDGSYHNITAWSITKEDYIAFANHYNERNR